MIKKWQEFNESKYGLVKLSDTFDNLSSEFNLSDDVVKIKKDYKKLGRKKIINKIIKIINDLGEKNYEKLKSYIKMKYYINIPKFNSATNKKYLTSHWSSISTLIVILASINEYKNIETDKIKKEIEKLKDKLSKLEQINESFEDNYSDF